MSNYTGQGLYVHFKGGYYFVHGLCVIEATKETGVMYQAANGSGILNTIVQDEAGSHEEDVQIWVRPLANFNDQIPKPNSAYLQRVHPNVAPTVPRFRKIETPT